MASGLLQRDETPQAGGSQRSTNLLELVFLAGAVAVLVAWLALLAWLVLSL